MTVFITGPSGSGKSAYAEKLCAALGGQLVYIATMPVFSEEDRCKVARHHALRADRGFQTLEMPDRLSAVPPDATVLFECLSTFTANRIFSPAAPEEDADALWRELLPLLDRRGHTVVVCCDVGGDGETYPPETERYRTVLAELSQRVCARADAVIETVYGIPVALKGALPC